MKKRKWSVARIILTVLTVAAVAAIFYNSSLSAVESTGQSSPLTEMINRFLASVRIPLTLTEGLIRKFAHFTEYAVLGTLLTTTVHLYTQKRGKTLLCALPTGALIAALLNIRTAKAVPVILIGVCIAAAIMTLITYGVIHVVL